MIEANDVEEWVACLSDMDNLHALHFLSYSVTFMPYFSYSP